MGKLTINIPSDRMKELKIQSKRLNVSMEDLVILSIQEFLAQPDFKFRRAMDYVLDKNSELYQRLAK